MRVNLVSGISGVKRNNQNFKSKVVYEKSPAPLPQEVKDFVDKFEDNCPQNENGLREKGLGYSTKNFSVDNKPRGGESAYVYFVESKGYSSFPNFVIKELKPLKFKTRSEYGNGSLYHEYDMGIKAQGAQKERVQKPLGYVKTQNGSMFLITETMKNINDLGASTSKVNTSAEGAKINETYLKSALDTLKKFDDENLFHSDLTRSNVSIGQTDDKANFLDFQWSYNSRNIGNTKIPTFTFEPSEYVNNMAPFEANVVADYLIGMYGHSIVDDAEEKDLGKVRRAREVLKNYLKVRADYEPRTYKFDISVFKDPTDDILDAELLRLAILRNHRLQFLYTDDNIEKPRNMMKLVGYSAMANQAAKQLANFEPTNPPRNAAEKRYFEYMKEYGKFWHENTKNWYKQTALYLRDLAMGKEEAPGRFYKGLFRSAGLDCNISHFALLKDGSKALKGWDKNLPTLRRETRYLENSLEDIRDGIDISEKEFLENVTDLYN